jgi:hypothetical protein
MRRTAAISATAGCRTRRTSSTDTAVPVGDDDAFGHALRARQEKVRVGKWDHRAPSGGIRARSSVAQDVLRVGNGGQLVRGPASAASNSITMYWGTRSIRRTSEETADRPARPSR